MSVFFTGLLLGASLIIAIGAQNAYILKQGLLKSHVFIICLICSVSDALLIALGTSGIGMLVTSHPELVRIIAWLGGAYLVVFGMMSFRDVWKSETLHAAAGNPQSGTLYKTVATVLALTFLNPHVYLDTVLLIGSIAAPYSPQDRLYFSLGAMSASFLWFFSLGYGARLLLPIFKMPLSWKILNTLIALIMWGIAYQLIRNVALAG